MPKTRSRNGCFIVKCLSFPERRAARESSGTLPALVAFFLLAVFAEPTAADSTTAAASAPAGASALVADTRTHAERIVPLVRKYCIDCHGADDPKAGFRLDNLGGDLVADHEAAAKWNEALNRVNLGEMPPKEAPQPSAAERQQFVGWMTDELAKASAVARSTDGRVVLRRLNRAEYANAVESLTGVRVDTIGLPTDGSVDGFDTGGMALITSALHIEQYLHLAAKALAHVTDERPTRPATELWRLEFEEVSPLVPVGRRSVPYRSTFSLIRGGDAAEPLTTRHPPDSQDKKISLELLTPDKSSGYGFYVRGPWASIPMNGHGALGFRNFLVREPGWYRIRARAQCRYDARQWTVGPPQLLMRRPGGGEWMKATFSGPDRPEIFETTVWLDRGQRCGVHLEWANTEQQATEAKLRGLKTLPPSSPLATANPRVEADWLEIEGPCFDFVGWPAPQQRDLLAGWDGTDADREGLASVMRRFVARAYRRPVNHPSVEIEPYVRLYETARGHGNPPLGALRTAWSAVLSSSRFLFLFEPGADNRSRKLDAFELASRLSFFLWSAPPDDELLAAAADGRLLRTGGVAEQVRRLLDDPRSAVFCERFATQWLDLDRLLEFAPDVSFFPQWHPDLREAMRTESIATFADVLHRNRPAREFLDRDAIVVNERLAAHYGLSGVLGERHRLVPTPASLGRGGLLTQGSVLCLTSNGSRTSPVKRGVYLLERVLGSPPPPPPPNAGEIANKVPGEDQVTVRERLRLHRDVASCAACHNKIDPLGFALERYDGIGQLRDLEYSGDPRSPATRGGALDASGVLPDGTKFASLDDLKTWLKREEARFVRCLTSKLFTYALGREPEFSDRELIERLVAESSRGANTLRDLIVGIAASEAFGTK
jgi:mono/diheme cytochrome c family protein